MSRVCWEAGYSDQRLVMSRRDVVLMFARQVAVQYTHAAVVYYFVSVQNSKGSMCLLVKQAHTAI